MENVILFDSDVRDNLLPLTFTRPICELRVGILRIREKWEKWFDAKVSYITQDYLSKKYPIHIEDDNFVINGAALPSEPLCRLITQLEPNEALLKDGELIAARMNRQQFDSLIHEEEIDELAGFELGETPFLKIDFPWELFSLNDQAIREDFRLLTEDRTSQKLSDSNRIIGNGAIFVEEGATVEDATLNTTTGPIYIGREAQIMEGSLIRGPFALCEHATVKMGAKIYGATTIGPHSKVGGEVNNIVLTAYSNKSHDGFLGNAVLGEWCNLGADTNNSNLKNNYSEVKLWHYPSERFHPTNLQFCGLIMGDHAKCGINTMFNTGTVVGVSANIFGAGYPRNFVPSFTWGGPGGMSTFQTSKAFDTAKRMMIRRNIEFDEVESNILKRVFELTAQFRRWEKQSNPV